MTYSSSLHQFADQFLIPQFKLQSGGNYLAHEIEDIDGQSYIVSLQVCNGETPLDQLQVAKEKLAAIEVKIQEAEQLAQGILQHSSHKPTAIEMAAIIKEMMQIVAN